MDPSPLEKLKEPLVTSAEWDKSIEAFERKRQEKVERQKNEIINAATDGIEFKAVSLHSLTDNAKMLSLSLLFIMCHLVTGVLYFHHIVGWPIDDSLYFCVVSITTVGFGDMVPESPRDKLFTCVYLLFGVWVLGYAIGVMLSCFDEWQRRRTAERQKCREALAAGGAAVAAAGAPASISGELSRAIMGSAARIMLWVSLGATFFGLVEGRGWVDAVYLTMVSLSTVGYGDLSPKTKAARLFCAAFLLVGTAVLGAELTFLAQLPLRVRRERLERQVLNQYGDRLDIEHLKDLCGPQMRTLKLGQPPNTHCTRAEFILAMLVRMEKILPPDVLECGRTFDRLDVTRSGKLEVADVLHWRQVARRSNRSSSTPTVSSAALLSARKRRCTSGDVTSASSSKRAQADTETGVAAGEGAAAPHAGAAAADAAAADAVAEDAAAEDAAAAEEAGEGERLLRQLLSLEAEQEEQSLLQRLRTAPRNGKDISARPHFGRHNSAGKSKFEASLSVLLSAHRESRQRARNPAEIEDGMEWRNSDHMYRL